jgi:uncharacterized protein (DUF1778 family)
MKDNAMILFRVTPEEKKLIKFAAMQESVSMREYIYNALMEKITSSNLSVSRLNLLFSEEMDS